MSDEIRNDIATEQDEQQAPEQEETAQNESATSQPDDAPKKKGKKERKKLTPEQKKKRTIKALIITGSVLLAIIIFFSGCAIATAVGTNALINQACSFEKVQYTEHTQLAPQNPQESGTGYWTFTKEDGRDFKILQFTDVHIGGGSFSQQKDAWAMNAVATMIRAEQPDLVVVTGDIAYPVPFQAGTFNNLNATKIFSNMMESLGVYWTFAFGNHDTERYSFYSRDQICDYYDAAGFDYCLFRRGFCDTKDFIGNDARGFGNDMIVVKNSDGSINQTVVTLDTHSYAEGDALGIAWKYDNLHQCQVDWYTSEIDRLVALNSGNPVNNVAFFHIPIEEYRDAWANVIDSNEEMTADKLVATDRGTTEFIYGIMGESDKTKNGVRTYGVYCGSEPNNFFEEGLTHGLQGAFCGHDHYNNFSVNYTPAGATRSIRLTYGMSVDYLAYPGIFKEHSQRGCTRIELKGDGTFDCAPLNYYADFNVSHERD